LTYLLQADPIAFSAGPLKIHWYGLMYLLGFAVAWWLGNRRVRAGTPAGRGFTGLRRPDVLRDDRRRARWPLGYILFYDFHTYVENPLAMLKVWEGGMSFHGGLLGVVAAVWWWSRKHALHVVDTLEFVAPLVPPGLGFGRLGNFINGELWGKETGAGLGRRVPSSLEAKYRAMSPDALRQLFDTGALNAFARHPSQLYQAFLEGLVLVHRAVGVFAQAAAALRGGGPVRAAVRRVPFPRRVRARARCAARIPRLRLGHDGPGVEPAADRPRPGVVVDVAPRADAAARVA
jgi:phosphatidylglycerol:prolipoprotein diacylglycerol transferase